MKINCKATAQLQRLHNKIKEEDRTMRQLFHTPEGVRDVYGTECAKKLYLQRKMEKIFHAYGYQSIETPTFEFFDVFGKQVGTTPSRELYKFFDRDGNTLVLRPDFTPSIARAASMYYHQEDMPIRLCYSRKHHL